jgi:hypothetical protein
LESPSRLMLLPMRRVCSPSCATASTTTCVGADAYLRRSMRRSSPARITLLGHWRVHLSGENSAEGINGDESRKTWRYLRVAKTSLRYDRISTGHEPASLDGAATATLFLNRPRWGRRRSRRLRRRVRAGTRPLRRRCRRRSDRPCRRAQAAAPGSWPACTRRRACRRGS